MTLTEYDDDDDDGPILIDDMSDNAVREELAELRKSQEEADHLILQWKRALIDIRNAAHRGELETVKRLAQEALS